MKKLVLTLSQQFTNKDGLQTSIEGKKVTVHFDRLDTTGQIVGACVDRLFDWIEFTRSKRCCPFNLSKEIRVEILFNDNQWIDGSRLQDESACLVKIGNTANKRGEQRLGAHLKQLLGIIMKDTQDAPDLQSIIDGQRLSVDAAGRLALDTPMIKMAGK
jgi:hypothetical protein